MRSNLREQDCCCVQQIQECVSAEEWLIESTRTSLLAAVSVGEKYTYFAGEIGELAIILYAVINPDKICIFEMEHAQNPL